MMGKPLGDGLRIESCCYVTRRQSYGLERGKNWYTPSTFDYEFTEIKNAVYIIEDLCYKLRMFGVPIDGQKNIFCDNGSVC